MHSLRRSCQSALQSANATKSTTQITRRAFSRSAAHHRGALPVYLPPSTQELATLLQTANSRVLLPLHLTRDQAKLVFRQENRAKLESEPIEITLGDVTLPLEHLDRNKDIPARFTHLRAIIAQSKTQDDWENVLRVVEGYGNAGIRLKTPFQAQIVRKLNLAGMHHLILKALQRPEATGLRLRSWDVIREVLRAVRDRAAGAEWGVNELRKALSMAEQVVELMEHKEHLGKSQTTDGFQAHPVVVALPLEMAAELAYRHDQDAAVVKKYAQRLMTALKQHEFLSTDIAELHTLAARRPADFPHSFEQAAAAQHLAFAAYDKISLWNGLSTARTVLEDNMPMASDAERVQKELYAAIKAAEEGLRALGERDGKPFNPKTWVSDAVRQCEEDDE